MSKSRLEEISERLVNYDKRVGIKTEISEDVRYLLAELESLKMHDHCEALKEVLALRALLAKAKDALENSVLGFQAVVDRFQAMGLIGPGLLAKSNMEIAQKALAQIKGQENHD